MENKKKNTIIPVILLIICLMILGFLSYVFFHNLSVDSGSTVDSAKFSTDLTNMGETIYKDYYYEITKVDKTDEELKEFLSKFKDIGLSLI